jgi:DDE family transposase
VCAVLDDLVIALYVTVDELLGKRPGPGRPPRLSEAELVCLAVAQVLLGCHSERRWLRFVGHRLGHLFPYVPGQSGYNRRLRAAAPALRLTLEHLARTTPSWWDQWRLLDATPVPCGASRQTVQRSALAEWASYGWDPSHSRWYWGLKLYVLAAPDGMPVAWGLATPRLGEREVAAELLGLASDHGLLRQGMVIAADKGLAGRAFAQGVAELGAVLVRPDRRDEPHRFGSLGRFRQWVESTFDTLKDQLGLERHGAHTPQGLWVRVAQRLLALAAGIWFNWQLGINDKRSLVAYDH